MSHYVERLGLRERRTYVIAEAGTCGDATPNKMAEQIDRCADAGCDAVKFQWTSSAKEMARRRGRATADGYDLIYQRYLEWPDDWHAILQAKCQERGVDYLCSVYLASDVYVVSPYVSHFKVSSFEALDWTLQSRAISECLHSLRKCMFVSVGMCSDDEVETLRRQYAASPFVALLHCVTAYPTPFGSMNLSSIYRNGLDGFSDHTDPAITMTGALAVAAGARIIEAHMRLENTDPLNPDAAHAMTPDQLSDYVSRIRMVAQAMSRPEDDDVQDNMRCYRVGDTFGD